MRFYTSLLCLALWAFNQLSAEGTRQLAPNGSIDIMGNTTTDIAALHINNPAYNSFASYNNPNAQSRLYIHLTDPSRECIYLGFSWAHNNITSADPPRINFEYRIKDPNGVVVYGPVTVTPVGANIQSWSAGWNGPAQLNGPAGYNATLVSSLDLISSGWVGKGDYYIEFQDAEFNDLLIDFWDITVADCSNATPVEKPGRVWSYNWSIFAINDFNFPNRPFNGAFYVCAPDPDNPEASFVTKIDFNNSGFRPAAFNIAFNSFGSQNTGNVAADRRSVELVNATQAEYSIFLNDPVDICVTAEVGQLSILGISRCASEEYCIKFTTSKAGLIDLLLDFDGGDNMYTPGTADVMIPHLVTQNEVGVPTCLSWDGLDGLGNPLPENVGTQIPITIAFAQGIYHFPIYDAELMTNGFNIEAVRPAASITNLHYDDSNITVVSGSGEPPVQLSGCTTPCHRWTNYTMPNTPGFGNLNTINSWWFSQLIIRQDVFFLPSYYACEIEGPTHFCQGGTSQLTMSPLVYPAGATGGEIIQTVWQGPGIIGSNTGSTITIGTEGSYVVRVRWLTSLGDSCETSCTFDVTVDPPSTETIDLLLVQGETIDINGEIYSEGGQYIQELSTAAGCDSILTINITVLNTIIHYDLDACESFMSNGSHMDYSEFIPTYPQPLPCATIVADTLSRSNLQMKHSCTPGVNNSVGMCVMTLPGCTYIAGHDLSVIIEVNVVPDPDTAVHLTGFSFYEKAPTTFEWISGNTGPNNYPTWFRVRVLKNGSEIYLSPPTPTSPTWKQEVFDFLDNDLFLVKDPSLFRFELLSYCPVGNGATESVWDLDEIDIVASCASVDGLNKDVSGEIISRNGHTMEGVDVSVYDVNFNEKSSTITDETGRYIIKSLPPEKDYYLRANKNTDFLNGVSTIDLIYIQRHLLGLEPFDSPYQMIAADANKSNGVSAIDILELRKLILGTYTQLPRNTSWRFGIASQELGVEYPWSFKETQKIEYLDEDLDEVDFIGVKIGDLNGDVVPEYNSLKITGRGSENFVIEAEDQLLKTGKPVEVEIKGQQLTDVYGLQIALKVQGGRIIELKDGMINFNPENYVISPNGELRLSWSSVESIQIKPGDVLFRIVVVSDKEGSLTEALHIGQNSIKPEVYSGENLESMDIALEIIDAPEVIGENHLFICEPNPFTESTTIRFQLQQPGLATIGFFDLSGRKLTEKTGYFQSGINAVEISKSEIGHGNSIVICHLQADGFMATQKLVLLKE